MEILQGQSRKLTEQELGELSAELDAIRLQIKADLGESDARYIRRVVKAVRYTGASGRFLLFFGFFPPTWILGTLLLGLSKILENMELGHNVLHGQYDWMRDPSLNSQSYEWDIMGTSANWRKTHNFQHHTYTNIKGLDDDLGYGVLRLFPEQRWKVGHLFQPIYSVIFALFFQWGVAIQDLRLGRMFSGKVSKKEMRAQTRPVWKKIRFQLIKDYVFFPILSGPFFLAVLSGNFVANTIRNLWTFTVIFCGHFTAKVAIYPRTILQGETKGQWYVRQILGSSNLRGGILLHIMTGNLSHQIEHHLFPDLPACRYRAISHKVRDLCERYGLQYNTGSLAVQFSQVIWRIVRYALPATQPRRLSIPA